MPEESAPTTQPGDPSTFSEPAALDSEALREQVTAMALCGRGFEDIVTTIDGSRESRSAAIEEEYQQRLFAGRSRINEVDRSIVDIDSRVERAKVLRLQEADLAHQESERQQEIARLRSDIARRRAEVARERLKTIIDRATARWSTAEIRLTEEQRTRRERHILEIQKRAGEIEERLLILRNDLTEIEQRLTSARSRLEPVVNRKVTRTVAGFLLWVGYISFAGIGSAVALLLPGVAKDSPLSQIFFSVQLLVGAFPRKWNAIEVFLASSIGVVLFIALFGAVVVLNDKLLRWFDRDWNRASKQRGRPTKRDRQEFNISSTSELRRGNYVQLIASLPYILVSVATVCLLAVTAHLVAPGQGTPQTQVSISIVTTYLGSVLALLITSSFVMYIVKVLERPEENRSWSQGWPFLAIPAVLVAGILYATYRASGDQHIWGLLVLFMLLSCLATAYGVVYRGLFRDVDYLERERRRCLRSIAEVQGEAYEEDEDDETVRELRQNLRKRREELDQLEDFAWDELEPATQHWYDGLTQLFSRKPEISVPLELLRVSEEEAAPAEHARIAVLEGELRDYGRQRAVIATEVQSIDLGALGQRRSDLIVRKDAEQAEIDSLEFRRKRAQWELKSRFDAQLVELRATYDLAAFVRPRMSGDVPRSL